MKQKERIINHLEIHGCINPLSAWRECGVYRLSAVIFELRKAGLNISTNFIKVRNSFNEEIEVANYILNGEQNA